MSTLNPEEVILGQEVNKLRLHHLNIVFTFGFLNKIDLDVGDYVFSNNTCVCHFKNSLDINKVLLVKLIRLRSLELLEVILILLLLLMHLKGYLEGVSLAHDVEEILVLDLKDGLISLLVLNKEDGLVIDN